MDNHKIFLVVVVVVVVVGRGGGVGAKGLGGLAGDVKSHRLSV